MTAEDRPAVLVVDDDHDVLRSLERTLEGPYEVASASAGPDALAYLEGSGSLPDLVLLDIHMPGMDGYEVCRRMQDRDEWAWIPVVFLTGLDSVEKRKEAFAAGAAAYLPKPFDTDELLRAVSDNLGTRERWSSLRATSGQRRPTWLLPAAFAAFRRSILEDHGATEDQARAAGTVQPGAAYEIAGILDISDEQFARHLARFLEVSFVDRIPHSDLSMDALPRTFSRSNLVLSLSAGRVVVSNPFDWELMNVLQRTVWRQDAPRLSIAPPEYIRSLCKHDDVDAMSESVADDSVIVLDEVESGHGDGGPEGVQAVADEILIGAIAQRASDVHIEPKAQGALVRYRIDGDMHDVRTLAPEEGTRLISRLKALAGMDIAERRKPQDGALMARLRDRRFRLRLATSSTGHGETMVIRLLEPEQTPVQLEELGFTESQARTLRGLADRKQGMILVVGPTGSGKSTTIFTVLSGVDGRSRSIMSVEDPVEYRIPYANQQQVNERAGVTFEALLKSAMRQDPDILFLGEVRDPFSARTAMDFASSGHLTISTLHSSNSTTAVFRLERLGVERGAMADAVTGVVAQKLLKKLCPQCKDVGPITGDERRMLEPYTDDPPARTARPVGCPACRESGYHGRDVVGEILAFDSDVARLVREGSSIAEIRRFAAERGDYLIGSHGLDKVGQHTFSVGDVYESVLVEEPILGGRGRSARLTTPPGPGEDSSRASGAVAPVPRERSPSSDLAPSLHAPSSSARILVVDDDEAIRDLVELHLTNAGYQVDLAGDGIEALLRLGDDSFDAVVSDVNMPNLDGVKLMEMIGQKGLDLPAIIITGSEDESLEARLLEIGAADFIRKPVRKEVLLMRLRNAVRTYQGVR